MALHKNEFFQKRMLKEMESLGYTQTILARLSGIPVQDINRYATGKGEPTLKKLCLISIVLEVSADYLIGADRELKPKRNGPYKMDSF